MPTDKIKILYLAGRGRSGSTLFDNMLGQIDGLFNVGELRLWNRRLREDALCGCGERMVACPVWSAVFEQAFGGLRRTGDRDILDLHESGARYRDVSALFFSRGRGRLRRQFGEYLESLRVLYEAIQAVTGARVIVDSSKSPSYGLLLGLMPTIDLYVVHLVRDPRAVAYSWLRQKQAQPPPAGDPLYRRHIGPALSSLLWNVSNAATERLERVPGVHYLRLRYEDLLRAPADALQRTLAEVGMADAPLPLVNDTEVKIGKSHTVSGNPNRFKTGNIQLRLDDAWTTTMLSKDRRLVTALTWPWRRHYGYR